MLTRTLQAIWRDCAGSALVEGAVVVPVLFVLMFGIYEFAWLFYQQQLILTGVRDATRYLARSATPCDYASPDWLIKEEYAKNLAITGSINGGKPRAKGWTTSMVTPHCLVVENPPAADGLTAYRGGPAVYVITVSARFTDPALGLFAVLGLLAPVISVAHSERATGPG